MRLTERRPKRVNELNSLFLLPLIKDKNAAIHDNEFISKSITNYRIFRVVGH
jgi:hypothetical protein